jgi:hypothetical protein
VLWGRVEGIDIAGGAVAALGQVMHVSDQTVFASDLAGGIHALTVDDVVSVSGFRNAYGAIVATRIERRSSSATEFKTTGAITAVDLARKRLQINGLAVDYASASVEPPAAAVATGLFVEVAGAMAGAEPTLIATRIAFKRQGLSSATLSRAQVEGYVTSIDPTDARRFHVDGLPVSITAATSGGSTLTIDAPVRVAGTISSAGAVAATDILSGFNLPPGRVAVDGRVFDAYAGPVADARIDIWVQTTVGFGYSSTWARGGTQLTTGLDGRFSTDVPTGSLIIPVAYKAGFVQPCAVVRDAPSRITLDVELVAMSTLDASNPPPPLSAAGARTVTGLVYEQSGPAQLPLAGVPLWFGDSMGITYATTVSDRDGRYLACNLPNDPRYRGSTDLWAQKEGFTDTVITGIDTSSSLQIDVQMQRP